MVYTRDAQRARRLRERPHRDAAGRRSLPHRHRLGAAAARPRLDRRATSAPTSTSSSPTSARALGVLSLMGPRARELLARVSPDDLSPRGPEVLAHARDRSRPGARARRAHELRRRPGLRAVRADRDGAPRLPRAARGRRRLDLGPASTPATTRSTRCASRPGRRAWGAELGPDETPWEAGLAFAVKLDKPAAFIGRDALLRGARASRCARSCSASCFDDPRGLRLGRRGDRHRRRAGRRAQLGRLERAAGRCVALGYVRGAAAQRVHAGTPVQIDLWGEPVGATAWDDARVSRAAAPSPSRSAAVQRQVLRIDVGAIGALGAHLVGCGRMARTPRPPAPSVRCRPPRAGSVSVLPLIDAVGLVAEHHVQCTAFDGDRRHVVADQLVGLGQAGVGVVEPAASASPTT